MPMTSEHETVTTVESSPVGTAVPPRPWNQYLLIEFGPALAIAFLTFLAYIPSLFSDLVYDARNELLKEGFITSIANLPAVLTLKVLGMKLYLGTRPGQLLYLMLIAAVFGKAPIVYHLAGNLLHALNAALVYLVLDRLALAELGGAKTYEILRIRIAIGALTLLFALHPIVVETVSAIGYSSDLLVTFFTLLALLIAITFRPTFPALLVIASVVVVTISCFAAVTCKESGIATPLLLIAYWFLFRRTEKLQPWLVFLGAPLVVTFCFLAARFLFAPQGVAGPVWLGGSLAGAIHIQPRLWVFMIGQLLWPLHLSADYTLGNVNGLYTAVAFVLLAIVLGLQAWLARQSRIGALGVAVYWLGLATVSNFLPLYRFLADRFYYLPLIGVTMQLLALLLFIRGSRWEFWLALAALVLALFPLGALNIHRQYVFANELTLWTDAVQVSPESLVAHIDLGNALLKETDRADEALVQYEQAVTIDPGNADACYDLGNFLLQRKQVEAAIVLLQKAVDAKPDYANAHFDLGSAYIIKGKFDQAIDQFQLAAANDPDNVAIYINLGGALAQKGQLGDAIVQFQKAIKLQPDNALAHYNLGYAFAQQGQPADALAQFAEAIRIHPDYPAALSMYEKVKATMPQGATGN